MHSTRQSRKLDHVRCALDLPDGPVQNGFQDVLLLHHCLPDLSLEDISLATAVGNQTLSHPLIINALTGGARDVLVLNERLAILARETQSILAVGSQYAALEEPALEETFRIVRHHFPSGSVWANLGAHATPAEAAMAVAMLDASALQLHLNVAQELFMLEGDRDFRGYRENIAAICRAVSVPVIVKEVGCGMQREAAEAILTCGVAALDVGGAGGTNFIAIEAKRCEENLPAELLAWGIPTAYSLLEVGHTVQQQGAALIASGGVRTAVDVVKALALGADAVALAAPALRLVWSGDLKAAVREWQILLMQVRKLLLLSGCSCIKEVQKSPVVLTGLAESWSQQRGLKRRFF
nr:type 2 isopentenyl-diphosphate Delta-isomerase [uncultured Anaeromusa sp.]